MKTSDVIALFGGKAPLAKFLGIQPPAVYQWGDEVPLLRQYQLKEKRPTIERDLETLARSRKRDRAESRGRKPARRERREG